MKRLIEIVPEWPFQELKIAGRDALALTPDRWIHYRTDCSPAHAADAASEGLTAWVWSDGTRRAVIAWEWLELSMGVLVLADPNGLASNLRFIGELQGMERVDPRTRNVLMLNTIVHGLRWQERVLSEIRRAPASVGNHSANFPLH